MSSLNRPPCKVGSAEIGFSGNCNVSPTAARPVFNAHGYPKQRGGLPGNGPAKGCCHANYFGTSVGIYAHSVSWSYGSALREWNLRLQRPCGAALRGCDILDGCATPQSRHHPVSGQLFFGLPNTVLVVANCLDDPTIRLKGRPSMPGWGEQGSYVKQKLWIRVSKIADPVRVSKNASIGFADAMMCRASGRAQGGAVECCSMSLPSSTPLQVSAGQEHLGSKN